MSKSTPIRLEELYRLMKPTSPEALPQVNDPAAPPVLMMYFLPALTKACTFEASSAGVIPAQFSEVQSPVANAQVRVLFGMACVTGSEAPLAVVCCAPVFQFASTVMSLYGLKMRLEVQVLHGVGVGVALVGVGVGPDVQLPSLTQGCPLPAGPLLVSGSLFCVQNAA